MSYIEVNSITKNFKKVKALNNISLQIEKGELISLLGPSGCGKSTLLRIIAGLESEDAGTISVDAKDISTVPANKRNMGMVFQAYSLFPNMNVQENIAFGLKIKRISKNEINTRVAEMIHLVGLEGREAHYPNQLSGGQMQRVALARALIVNPDILLLDEPLSALDAKIRENLRFLIKDIQQKLKITTIFVTHDQEEALSISDKIFIMNNGFVEQEGTPEEIYKNPCSQFVANFIGKYNFFNADKLNMEDITKNFIMRPEHINLYDSKPQTDKLLENEILLEGKINEIYFLGTVVRFKVVAGENPIFIDLLNKNELNYKIGDTVYLEMNKNDFVFV